jgi:hypothetical protein
MTGGRMIELAAAVVILGLGVWLYRRRARAGSADGGGYGSQGAVILFVIAAIMGIHALGGLDYRPTQSELDMMKSGAR